MVQDAYNNTERTLTLNWFFRWYRHLTHSHVKNVTISGYATNAQIAEAIVVKPRTPFACVVRSLIHIDYCGALLNKTQEFLDKNVHIFPAHVVHA